jgi:hypothetical protein
MQIAKTVTWELMDNDGNKVDSDTQEMFEDLVELMTSENILGATTKMNHRAAIRVTLILMDYFNFHKKSGLQIPKGFPKSKIGGRK